MIKVLSPDGDQTTLSGSHMRLVIMTSLVGKETGVPRKILSMLKAVEEIGHTPYLLPLTSLFGWDAQLSKYLLPGFREMSSKLGTQGIGRTLLRLSMITRLRRAGVQAIIYRYELSLTNLFVLKLARIPFVVEHNTIELSEIKQRRALNRERRWGFLYRRFAHGLIAVTPEILGHQLSRTKKRKPGVVISNSADLSDHSLYKKRPSRNCRLVFVAGIERWHGIDRLIKLLKELPQFELLVVGSGRGVSDLESLATQLDVNDRVSFLGPLHGSELDSLLVSCDVAISSLALHRVGLKQACPLKTRHYLALGLPVIIGYDDIDLNRDLPFVLRVSADEDLIPPEEVREFYDRVTKNTEICQDARSFAEGYLSTKAKMRQLVEFLETLTFRSKSSRGQ